MNLRLGVLPVAAMLLLSGVLIAACGGDGEDAGNGGDGADATEAAGDGVGGDATEPADDDGDGSDGADVAEPADDDGDGSDDVSGGDGGSPGSGSATLTIGDESWSFDDVYCRFTQEETGDDRISFFLIGRGETAEGVGIQLYASIKDEKDDGRYEGDGVSYSVTLGDAEDFENPALKWLSLLFPREGDSLLHVDGKNVTADMSFRDWVTGAVDEIPGTLQATCP